VLTDTTGKVRQRVARWCDFYDNAAPPRHMVMVRYNEGLPDRPLPYPDRVDARIEWAWTKYRRQMEQVQWLDDDTVPYLDVYTGTDIFAAAFGCRVHLSGDTMPFVLPRISSASEVAALQIPRFDTQPLDTLFQMADELRRRAGDDALLRLVDIQTPMDIAALIWDKNSFYMAMIESPEAVKELAAKVSELLVVFLDEWFARYGQAFIAHFPDYYMPGGVTVSEDEIGAVNGEMFLEFFLPELVALSQRYGDIGVHCCAHARHQWPHLKAIPDLRLLNLVQPKEVLADAYGEFADHVPQMHSWCGDGNPAEWIGQYPQGSRVVLQVPADTRDEAARRCDEVRSALSKADEPGVSPRAEGDGCHPRTSLRSAQAPAGIQKGTPLAEPDVGTTQRRRERLMRAAGSHVLDDLDPGSLLRRRAASEDRRARDDNPRMSI